MKITMQTICFWLSISIFSSPTNNYFSSEPFVKNTSKKVHKELCNYVFQYFEILQKHMDTEFEVQIRDGEVTPASQEMLQKLQFEHGLFQYKNMISKIILPWVHELSGQPMFPETVDKIKAIIPQIITILEAKIQLIQGQHLVKRRADDNKLCKQKCSSGPQIHNLTTLEIPKDVIDLLSSGLHIVPNCQLDRSGTKKLIENNLKSAAISHFRTTMGYYPYGTDNMEKLDELLQHLSKLTPCGSEKSEFYFKLRDIYISSVETFLDSVKFECEMINPKLPRNVVITISDKNLGVCLVPIEWYPMAYDVLVQKGGYILIDMSEEACISMLKDKIQELWNECTPEMKILLKSVMPKHPTKKYRIGVMKIIPKIHKLIKIDSESWKKLAARPIRGAENCPLNASSKALCTLLQNLMKDVSSVFPFLTMTPRSFPCLKGCDEYSSRITKIPLKSTHFSQTVLMSGDFSDAYTESQTERLKSSIKYLGKIVHYADYKVQLIMKLVDLVFNNCYFFTPYGLYRQGRGMPMGGHASRDCLDVDLVRTEVEMLVSKYEFLKEVLEYGRMVDDISSVVQGDFTTVVKLILLMAAKYPTMPLNIQISFCYSRFLDIHLYNILNPKNEFYNLYSTLAWKEMNSFCYQPLDSNKHPKYKDSVVPITMHRIQHRCTDERDRNHHRAFIYRILSHRSQDMLRVRKSIQVYKQRHSNKARRDSRREFNAKYTYSLTYDKVTKSHVFVQKTISQCASNGTLRPVFKSQPSLASILCPKRKIIKRLKNWKE